MGNLFISHICHAKTMQQKPYMRDDPPQSTINQPNLHIVITDRGWNACFNEPCNSAVTQVTAVYRVSMFVMKQYSHSCFAPLACVVTWVTTQVHCMYVQLVLGKLHMSSVSLQVLHKLV